MANKNDKDRKRRADYTPGFGDGVASVFGVSSLTDEGGGSGFLSLKGDWENVGNDIRKAMDKYAMQ